MVYNTGETDIDIMVLWICWGNGRGSDGLEIFGGGNVVETKIDEVIFGGAWWWDGGGDGFGYGSGAMVVVVVVMIMVLTVIILNLSS